MEKLTKLIFDDMKPALGVTEPGAIAFLHQKQEVIQRERLKKFLLK